MPLSRPTRDFLRQLEGHCLATAEILYRLPDHPALLQTYLWQGYDMAPDFPRLERFLVFWRERLDGPIHSVRVAHCRLLGPGRWRNAAAELTLH